VKDQVAKVFVAVESEQLAEVDRDAIGRRADHHPVGLDRGPRREVDSDPARGPLSDGDGGGQPPAVQTDVPDLT